MVRKQGYQPVSVKGAENSSPPTGGWALTPIPNEHASGRQTTTTANDDTGNAITFEDVLRVWEDLQSAYPRVLSEITCHPSLVYRLFSKLGFADRDARGYVWTVGMIPINEDEECPANQAMLKFSDGSEETVVIGKPTTA